MAGGGPIGCGWPASGFLTAEKLAPFDCFLVSLFRLFFRLLFRLLSCFPLLVLWLGWSFVASIQAFSAIHLLGGVLGGMFVVIAPHPTSARPNVDDWRGFTIFRTLTIWHG